jgi:hypothetical protein
LPDLHQRRQGVLRHGASLLRLHDKVHESRLSVLRIARRHAGLLRLLLTHRRSLTSTANAAPAWAKQVTAPQGAADGLAVGGSFPEI